MSNKIIAIGAILTGLAVIMGAFGAHALEDRLINSGRLDTYQTAVDYHFVHAIAIMLTGVFNELKLIKRVNLVVSLFIAGLFLFSGSLYVLAIFDLGYLGAITPFGGVSFIVAWGLLVFQLLRK